MEKEHLHPDPIDSPVDSVQRRETIWVRSLALK